MNILKAVLLKLTSALMFSVMSAFVRYVSDVTPVGQVVFCRSFFAILPVMIIYAWRGELRAAFRTARPLGHLGRGAIREDSDRPLLLLLALNRISPAALDHEAPEDLVLCKYVVCFNEVV